MNRYAWLGAAIAVAAAPDAEAQAALEKLPLKPHRVNGLTLGYGYTLGEFVGEVRTRAASTRALIYTAESARTNFTVSRTGWAQPLTADCAGGESHMNLGWIQFRTRDLKYVCTFQGGPPDAGFALAFADVGGLAALQQPQRAAQLVFDGVTLRAETRRMPGTLPIGGGRVLSYQITRDGREVGGLVRGVLQPTFLLPSTGSAERDAAAVMALSLFFFPDPADRQ